MIRLRPEQWHKVTTSSERNGARSAANYIRRICLMLVVIGDEIARRAPHPPKIQWGIKGRG
jgi:hypothetical protein